MYRINKNKYVIAEYNLNDELIDLYENYKELAIEFQTSVRSVQTIVCRHTKGEIEKSYNKTKKLFVKLYKINIEE